MVDVSKCEDAARRMAANAKSGTLVVNGRRYALTFDTARWLYAVTLDGQPFRDFTDLNTKSLKQARQWLRNYLEN